MKHALFVVSLVTSIAFGLPVYSPEHGRREAADDKPTHIPLHEVDWLNTPPDSLERKEYYDTRWDEAVKHNLLPNEPCTASKEPRGLPLTDDKLLGLSLAPGGDSTPKADMKDIPALPSIGSADGPLGLFDSLFGEDDKRRRRRRSIAPQEDDKKEPSDTNTNSKTGDDDDKEQPTCTPMFGDSGGLGGMKPSIFGMVRDRRSLPQTVGNGEPSPFIGPFVPLIDDPTTVLTINDPASSN